MADKELLKEAFDSIQASGFNAWKYSKATQYSVNFIGEIYNIIEENYPDKYAPDTVFDTAYEIYEFKNYHNIQSIEDACNAYFAPSTIDIKNNDEDGLFAKYLKQLQDKNWKKENIDIISNQTKALAEHIKNFTMHNPEKLCSVLVVGHVQSGKTANYCADINYWLNKIMKNEEDYNTFIVLTDNKTSLGLQTQKRLCEDIIPVKEWLQNLCDGDSPEEMEDSKNLKKHGGIITQEGSIELYRLSGCSYEKYTPELQGNIENRRAIIFSAIKNRSQIEYMKNYFDNNEGISSGVVIIDDEADIITPAVKKKGDPKIVRKRILELINLFKKKNIPVVYIGFTATPYANVLNIPPNDEKNPLFPNIIQVLDTPKEYFGTDRIFGTSGDTAKWIHELADNEAALGNGELSESLKDAFSWFLCTVAARRTEDSTAGVHPVSMMIHPSLRNNTNRKVFNCLKKYAEEKREDIITRCQRLWENIKGDCSWKDLPADYPDRDRVNKFDFKFEKLKEKIEKLLDADRTEKNDQFGAGLNFRLLIGQTSNDFHYPAEDDEIKNSGSYPAFVVIGGNCISRGLTLEGMTSVYFTRETKYSDTLLQFARWNGYRKGFEILPRIWIRKGFIELFRQASYMEKTTRNDMRWHFESPLRNEPQIDHWKEGVRVYGLPNAGIIPTGKMQKSDFSKQLNYDTNTIPNDPAIWAQGVKDTSDFIEKIGGKERSSEIRNNIVWEDISSNLAFEYLQKMKKNYPDSTKISSLLANKVLMNKTKWNVAFVPLKGDNKDRNICEVEGFFKGYQMRQESGNGLRNNNRSYGFKHVHVAYEDYVADVYNIADTDASKKENIIEILKNYNKLNDALILIYLEDSKKWAGIAEEHKNKPVILLSVRWYSEDKKVIYSVEVGLDDVVNEPEENDEVSQENIKHWVETYTYKLVRRDEDDENDENDDMDISCSFSMNDQKIYCTQINKDSTINEKAKEYLKEYLKHKGYDINSFLDEDNCLTETLKFEDNEITAEELAQGLLDYSEAGRVNWENETLENQTLEF